MGGVLAAALLAAPGLATAQSSDDDAALTTSPAAPATDPGVIAPEPPPSWLNTSAPRLACGVHPRAAKPGGASAATFACWLAGAPPDDSSFTVQLLRVGDPTPRPLATVCDAGALTQGAGRCVGSVTDPTGAPLIGGILVTATLQPSGLQVGPVHISPTLAAGL